MIVSVTFAFTLLPFPILTYRLIYYGSNMWGSALAIFETPGITSWLFSPEVHVSVFYGFDFVVCTSTCVLSTCAVLFVFVTSSL